MFQWYLLQWEIMFCLEWLTPRIIEAFPLCRPFPVIKPCVRLDTTCHTISLQSLADKIEVAPVQSFTQVSVCLVFSTVCPVHLSWQSFSKDFE